MQGRAKRKAIVITVLLALLIDSSLFTPRVWAADSSAAQAQIDANNQQVTQLNKEIAQYEAKLQQIGSDKKTLQQAIDALNLQRKTVEARISATQHTINTTQLQIGQLDESISSTSAQIAAEQAAVSQDLRNLQQLENQPLIARVLSSQDIAKVWQDVAAMAQFNSSMQASISSLRIKETNLADAQTAVQAKHSNLLSQRNDLQSQQTQLTQTKKTKTQLLSETNSKESTYQKLLAEAKATLASFSAFAQNAGGSGLLKNQTSCDAWGCYYNQRDVAWGNDPLNNTKYALKSDGCLITALAMVMTHYGYKDVTPVTINSNPGNFAAYYPAYLLFTAHIDGKDVKRVNTSIDKTLAAGTPVIVGLHAYGGTHFVVLTSGSNGNYLMRDPYVPNEKDIPFSSHYKMSQIYAVEKVQIS